ncbi:MlaE family ABC transporter permease [Marinicella gelatinilytica]|uniref:MlaE family ABC transporter permease n=1 Tax=Marinicella gelatinilytica TaxID=2996017 RepID=UPI002260CDF6|nr:ABC transporter permease [Marinicella gelatinilytica]MCX7544106.1 ABC transporter permease [Marinicella gelatinilytica]
MTKLTQKVENLGQMTVQALERLGFAMRLFWDSFYWLIAGRKYKQRLRFSQVVKYIKSEGVDALPIVLMLALVVGMMLAIQLIYALEAFGAESQVLLAIAKSVTREFSPLITGIIVAGRSGAAIAARIGSQTVSQEIDALNVMGVVPVRYLVLPPLLALIISMPLLIIAADIVAIFGGALFSVTKLDMSISAYMVDSFNVLVVGDIMQGLIKSVVFGIIIVLVGATTGFYVTNGAEGVGKATTTAVVVSISFIVFADMIASFFLTK